MANQYPNSYIPYMPYNGYQQPSPYMDRLANLQQFQQSIQQPIPQPQMNVQPQMQPQNYLSGKVVDSLDVVKATDIPMDGNMYYFPKADGTEVFAKRWMANGTTQIITYKPVFDDLVDGCANGQPIAERVSEDAIGKFQEGIMKRFDSLESHFADLKDSMTNPMAKATAS